MRATRALLAVTLIAIGTASLAKDDRETAEMARAALLRGEILPLAQILAIGARTVPGDVVDLELKKRSRGFIYELKILAVSGGLREVEIDARTGQVIEVEDEGK